MSRKIGAAELSGLILLTLTALSGPVRAAEIPASIRAEYENADSEGCKLPARAAQLLDLQGDGTEFYVVDSLKLDCPGVNPYCGSGGCGVDVFVRKPEGFVRILQDSVQSFRLSKIGGGYQLVTRHKTLGPTRYEFVRSCAVEIGSQEPPSCGESGK
jgi:hypothetical protein